MIATKLVDRWPLLISNLVDDQDELLVDKGDKENVLVPLSHWDWVLLGIGRETFWIICNLLDKYGWISSGLQ